MYVNFPHLCLLCGTLKPLLVLVEWSIEKRKMIYFPLWDCRVEVYKPKKWHPRHGGEWPGKSGLGKKSSGDWYIATFSGMALMKREEQAREIEFISLNTFCKGYDLFSLYFRNYGKSNGGKNICYWKITWLRTIILIEGILNLDSENLNGDLLSHCSDLGHNMTSLAYFRFFRVYTLKVDSILILKKWFGTHTIIE